MNRALQNARFHRRDPLRKSQTSGFTLPRKKTGTCGTAAEIRISRGQNRLDLILIVLAILLFPGLFLEGSR